MTRCAECIISDVSRAYRVTPTDMRSTAKRRAIAYARFAAWRLMRHETGLSLPQIGRLLGHRDHSTVINGIKAADRLLIDNPDFAARYEEARAL